MPQDWTNQPFPMPEYEPIKRISAGSQHFSTSQTDNSFTRTHKVGLARDTPSQDSPHSAQVVFSMDPVADVACADVELRADAGRGVDDLPWG